MTSSHWFSRPSVRRDSSNLLPEPALPPHSLDQISQPAEVQQLPEEKRGHCGRGSPARDADPHGRQGDHGTESDLPGQPAQMSGRQDRRYDHVPYQGDDREYAPEQEERVPVAHVLVEDVSGDPRAEYPDEAEIKQVARADDQDDAEQPAHQPVEADLG